MKEATLTWDLEQWATFRINADFDLSGKNVKAGDPTDSYRSRCFDDYFG